MSARNFWRAFFKGIWVFSLLCWTYIVIEIHIWPVIIQRHENLAVLVPIREDYMGVISFALAGVSFIVWEYLRLSDRTESADRKRSEG